MMDAQDDVDVFAPFFETSFGYLDFLTLIAPDAGEKMAQVGAAAQSCKWPFRAVGRLLDGLDWPPHLVAAVALAQLGYDEIAFDKLWRAMGRGSWVTPQLAVIAFLYDPDFSEKAFVRLKDMRPVEEPSELEGLTQIEREIADAPAGLANLSPKAAAALARLLCQKPEEIEPFAAEVDAPDLKKLVEENFDQAGTIAEEWLGRIREILA